MELSHKLRMNKTPILIPIKGISKRCPNKNKELLHFTVKLLERSNCMSSAIVISDSTGLLDLSKKYGLKTHLEIRDDGQDELMSCYNFIKTTSSEAFILLPVTHPFRDIKLIDKCYDLFMNSKNEINFITSYIEVVNRERFHINFTDGNPTFKNNHKIRMGESCTIIPMIDGAIYMIKSDFIKKAALYENTNKTFWRGKFDCIKNNAPFIDIDSIEDMNNVSLLDFYINNKF